MARIELDLNDRSAKPGRLTRLALGYGRRTYGGDLDSALALSHHPGVLFPWALMETAGQLRRSALPGQLPDLVTFVSAVRLGCSWCVDFGASLWEQKGLDPATLRAAVRWRDSALFDDDTRAAFAYAEAVSGDVDAVTDEMVADLRRRFGEKGVVELTYLVALENMRSRFNLALGLSSQGFSSGEACALAEQGWAQQRSDREESRRGNGLEPARAS